MIARPSYGGEREPDSHPTPGPPTFVQSAREQPSCALQGPAPRSSPGVVRSPGEERFVALADRPVETDLSPAAWLAEAGAAARPHTVAALVPPVCPAYARILHPAVA